MDGLPGAPLSRDHCCHVFTLVLLSRCPLRNSVGAEAGHFPNRDNRFAPMRDGRTQLNNGQDNAATQTRMTTRRQRRLYDSKQAGAWFTCTAEDYAATTIGFFLG